ncbi:hypothetical protein OUZ56_011842 [Daphnia magna]|uniref:Uncharacterized protein n=1 Tax=Daphnia magna TaxID=35525 RepID=A0ABQ9Z1I3_9CRUS|nr:hypothetical protein OUZ56_011842 [Daphnia magna]
MADYCNDVIDEFLEDMGNLTDNFDDLSTGSDNELRAENRRAKKRRLIQFYRTRKDILTLIADILPRRKTKAQRNLLPLDERGIPFGEGEFPFQLLFAMT